MSLKRLLSIVCIVWCLIANTHSVSYREYVFDYYVKSPADSEIMDRHRLHLDANDSLVLPPALHLDARPTYLYIHGYFSLPSAQHKEAEWYFRNKRDAAACCHFFIFDWSEGACWTEYHIAMQRTRSVAETGVKILKQLVAAKIVSLDTLTIVGHSLGAHVSGIIATLFWLEQQASTNTSTTVTGEEEELSTVATTMGETGTTAPVFDTTFASTTEVDSKAETSAPWAALNQTDADAINKNLVAVVVALDPAGVEYGDIDDDSGLIRLRNGRAVYTMVIHTNSIYGLTGRLGDADFYPNGGRYQWNCIRRSKPNIFQRFGRCSHRIASILYWKTLGDQRFLSLRCDDHLALLDQMQRKCVQRIPDATQYAMAGDVIGVDHAARPRGVFYLETEGVKDDIHPMPVANFTFGRREHEAEQMQKIRFPKWQEIFTAASRDIQMIS